MSDPYGGTLQFCPTGTIHVSRTVKPTGLTLCGRKYRIGKGWIWSYDEHAKQDCQTCHKRFWGPT